MAVIASVAMDLARDKAENKAKMTTFIEEAAEKDVDLILFPSSRWAVCQRSPCSCSIRRMPSISMRRPSWCGGRLGALLAELAVRHEIYIAWGMTEQSHESWDMIYNTLVLVGPEGYVGESRKVPLPLTERIMMYPGEGDYPVFDTRIGKVGLMICFDKAYPEVARTLALKGADILLCPTAWPSIETSEDDNDYKAGNVFSFARALENMCFFVDSCVSGPFEMGHSRIIGPNPMQVCATTGFEEGMAVADVDVHGEVAKARIASMAGSDLLKDRKPATYGELVKPNRRNPISGDIGQFTE
ncbi:MAG: carbon-nitrogen hydrolase family protein [Gordonibacter pamelaeae]